jgi:ATP-dependent helicase/nuclease subunit B
LEHYQGWLAEQQLADAGTLIEHATQALHTAAKAGTESLEIDAIRLDGLAELTPQELALLAALTPFCREAALAFCLESEPREDLPWLSTWSVISRTFRRCHALLAADERCEVSVELLARDPNRSRFTQRVADRLPTSSEPGPLRHLETHWTAPEGFSGPPGEALTLVQCANPEAEAVLAAREILRFVRAGHRFRDCAVLLRQMDTHHAGLRRVFTRYEIPFFLDRRESVAHHPLAEFTRGALHTVLFHWRFTDWFAVLKTGLTSLSPDEVDGLENIALARGWEGGKWLQPLALADDPALGNDCEKLRRRVIGPFERLRDSLGDQPDGRQLARALRRLWDDFEVGTTLENWSAASPDEVAHLTVLDELGGLLDNLEHAFGAFPLPLRDWLPILEAGLGALTVGVIPPAVDQVLIGAVDRSRNPDLKLAVVLGLNEGVFPQPPADPGLLTESDRETLSEVQVSLRHDARLRLGHERYLGYIACTRARERLILSWSEQDATGRVLNGSPLVAHIRRLFPAAGINTFNWPPPLAECLHPNELLGPLLLNELSSADDEVGRVAPRAPSGGQETVPVDSIMRELSELAADRAGRRSPPEAAASSVTRSLRGWLDHFTRCADAYRASRLSPEATARLYGCRLRTSASRLEQFAACPFQFFANAGLRARERDRFAVDARKTGTFLHEVLRQFHEELTAEGLRWRQVVPEAARQRIARIAREQLERVAVGVLAAHPRHVFLARHFTGLLQEFVTAVIEWMRTYQFDPLAVELAIGGDQAALPWWEIDLGAGRTLAFRGSVDRVDVAPVPGREDALCLTVLDYKSGNKRFEPLKMQAGLQLQLPAYLAALSEVAGGSALLGGKQAVPAGMFYVRLRDATSRAGHREEEPDVKTGKRFEHTGRFSFEWLPLFDSACASGGGGQFSYRLKKDGEPYANSHQLIRQTELENLLTDAKTLLQAMGRDILAGNIAVDPYRKGNELPCTYCDFKSVCRIDPWTHAYRPLRPLLAPAPTSAPK